MFLFRRSAANCCFEICFFCDLVSLPASFTPLVCLVQRRAPGCCRCISRGGEPRPRISPGDQAAADCKRDAGIERQVTDYDVPSAKKPSRSTPRAEPKPQVCFVLICRGAISMDAAYASGIYQGICIHEFVPTLCVKLCCTYPTIVAFAFPLLLTAIFDVLTVCMQYPYIFA